MLHNFYTIFKCEVFKMFYVMVECLVFIMAFRLIQRFLCIPLEGDTEPRGIKFSRGQIILQTTVIMSKVMASRKRGSHRYVTSQLATGWKIFNVCWMLLGKKGLFSGTQLLFRKHTISLSVNENVAPEANMFRVRHLVGKHVIAGRKQNKVYAADRIKKH